MLVLCIIRGDAIIVWIRVLSAVCFFFCLPVEGIRPEIMACGAVLVCMQPRSPGCGQGFRPVGKIEKDAWFCRWLVVSTILNAWAIVGEVCVLLYLVDDGECWINMGQLDVWWNDGGSRIDAQMIG